MLHQAGGEPEQADEGEGGGEVVLVEGEDGAEDAEGGGRRAVGDLLGARVGGAEDGGEQDGGDEVKRRARSGRLRAPQTEAMAQSRANRTGWTAAERMRDQERRLSKRRAAPEAHAGEPAASTRTPSATSRASEDATGNDEFQLSSEPVSVKRRWDDELE